MSVSVAVAGASGRLGSLVCEVVENHPGFALTAQLTSASSDASGSDAEVLVDVTRPDVSPGIVERAIRRGQRVIVGTSGWSADRLTGLQELVQGIPDAGVLVVPNFSLGSVIGTVLARVAAPHFDSVEIVEAHHPAKLDSPSGTAVRTAELIASERERTGSPELNAPTVDQAARGEVIAGVPVHSLRLQGVIARQEVRFGGAGEVLTITHDTHSQDAYRAGIRAALERIGTIRGLTVGLERILGLDRVVGLDPASCRDPAAGRDHRLGDRA